MKDKWITKWEYQLQDWKRQYAEYEAQIDDLKDQIDDIEREQWHVSGKMRELKEKIEARNKANASLK
jgi:peptidoglycan hydrolase CwlO-like protein